MAYSVPQFNRKSWNAVAKTTREHKEETHTHTTKSSMIGGTLALEMNKCSHTDEQRWSEMLAVVTGRL